VKEEIEQHFATMSGVAADRVSVDVEAASVLISVTIILPEDDATAVQDTLSNLLATPYDATQFLSSIAGGSISILRVEEISQRFVPPPQAPAASPLLEMDLAQSQTVDDGEDGEVVSHSLIIVAALGGLAIITIGVVAVVIVRICYRAKSKPQAEPTITREHSINIASAVAEQLSPDLPPRTNVYSSPWEEESAMETKTEPHASSSNTPPPVTRPVSSVQVLAEQARWLAAASAKGARDSVDEEGSVRMLEELELELKQLREKQERK